MRLPASASKFLKYDRHPAGHTLDKAPACFRMDRQDVGPTVLLEKMFVVSDSGFDAYKTGTDQRRRQR